MVEVCLLLLQLRPTPAGCKRGGKASVTLYMFAPLASLDALSRPFPPSNPRPTDVTK